MRRSNGVYELPLNPGESELNKCDQVFPPSRVPYQVDAETILTAVRIEPQQQLKVC